MSKDHGGDGSRRRRMAVGAIVSLAALLVGVLAALPSQAASPGNPGGSTFELEGNAQNGTVAGDDWESIFKGIDSATSSTGIVSDGSSNGTIFTGGGSKDTIDISGWRWKDNSGGLPDKDNLLDAFAARYGDLIVFGSDRFDNSGDAQEGFWFFQNKVSTNADGTFSGVHTEGDLLILSDFSIGGTVSNISVYEWVDHGGNVSTHLTSLFESNAANCLPTSHSGDVCGVVNPANGTETGGWGFTDKSGNDTYLQGEFYEGGIDLSAFPQFAGECFASFASETRSSQSPTATLKDFVVGDFQACQSSISTTQTWLPNDSATISVPGASSWTGGVTFTLYPTSDCTGTAAYSEGPNSVSNASRTASTHNTAVKVTATGTSHYSWKVDFTSSTPGVLGSSSCTETTDLTITN